jgi:two-component system sensor histidine kinase HydH
VIELTPTLSASLRDEAGRALWVGFASAAGLLIAAALLWRWGRHRDRLIVRLAHERRLAALGEMSAVLAHELRNPLASLKGNAELLVESLEGRDRDRAKAVRVVDEALRLERLTNDLLEFVRTGKIARRAVVPGEVLHAAARSLGEGGQAIAVVDAGAPPRWSIDPERLAQVLTNLLENAVQAAPGGPVTATVAVEERRLIYRVRDRGPGLPTGAPDAIFEPFHTTRVRGIGLGLAVARRLVELHGGTLTARTHPDGGAEFTVAIPEG